MKSGDEKFGIVAAGFVVLFTIVILFVAYNPPPLDSPLGGQVCHIVFEDSTEQVRIPINATCDDYILYSDGST